MTPISLFLAPNGSAGPPPGPPPKEPEGFALWLAASGPPPGQPMQTGEALRPQPNAGEEELDSRSAETAAAWSVMPAMLPQLKAEASAQTIGMPQQAAAHVADISENGLDLPMFASRRDIIARQALGRTGQSESVDTLPVFMGRREVRIAPITGQPVQINPALEQPLFMGRRETGTAPIQIDAPADMPLFMGRREVRTPPNNGESVQIDAPADQPLFMGRREIRTTTFTGEPIQIDAPADQPLFVGRRETGTTTITGEPIQIDAPVDQPLLMGRRETGTTTITGEPIQIDAPADQPVFMGRRESGTTTINGEPIQIDAPADQPLFVGRREAVNGQPVHTENASEQAPILGSRDLIEAPAVQGQKPEGVAAASAKPIDQTDALIPTAPAKAVVTQMSAAPEVSPLIKKALAAEQKTEDAKGQRDQLLHGLKTDHQPMADAGAAQSGSQEQPKDDGQRRLEAMRQASDLIQARQPSRVAVEIDRLDLGLIKLEMSHDRINEAVEASFEARRPETRDALVMAQPDLRRALDEKGVTLSRFDVSADAGQGSPQREGRFNESGRSAPTQSHSAPTAEAPISRSTTRYAGLEVIA